MKNLIFSLTLFALSLPLNAQSCEQADIQDEVSFNQMLKSCYHLDQDLSEEYRAIKQVAFKRTQKAGVRTNQENKRMKDINDQRIEIGEILKENAFRYLLNTQN